MGRVGRFRDRYDIPRTQSPGNRHLGRCRTMATRDSLKRGRTKQLADVMAQRRVGHQGNPVFRAPGQQIEFDPSAVRVIQHLIGRAA